MSMTSVFVPKTATIGRGYNELSALSGSATGGKFLSLKLGPAAGRNVFYEFNMKLQRRIIFWIFLCLFTVATVAYLVWTPYQPANLYRAIPAHASLVSSHQDLAERWQRLSTHLVLKSFFDASPSASDRPKNSRATCQIQPWIMRLARKDTVIAYVPARGPAEEPMWVGASWIGNASQSLRWRLCVTRIPGLDRVRGHFNGRPIWKLRQPLTQSGLRLSLAFGEGVILCCLSRNPHAMRQILLTYDGLAPSIASTPSCHPEIHPFGQTDANSDSPPTRSDRSLHWVGRGVPTEPSVGDRPAFRTTIRPAFGTISDRASAVMDQGWFHWLQPGRTASDTVRVSYAVSRLDSDHLAADIGIQPALPTRTPLTETLDIPAFGNMLGDFPALTLILPMDIIRDTLLQHPMSTPARVIRKTLKSGWVPIQNNYAVLALLAGSYSGGLGQEPFRIKIPTLLICLKVKDPDKIKPLVNGLADHVNAHYRIGLIIDPTPLPAGKINVTTLETTRPGVFADAAIEDRPAYAAIGQWLIFSSNARSLIQLLARYQNPVTSIIAPPGRWQKTLEASHASVFLWMDLDVCGRVLQLPLSMLAPNRPVDPAKPSAINGQIIKGLKHWLEDVRPLKSGAFWMDSDSTPPAFHLEIGEDKK